MAARKGNGGKRGGRKGGSRKGGSGFSPGGGKMLKKPGRSGRVKPKRGATGPTNADGGRHL
jgi:hypothetical protein